MFYPSTRRVDGSLHKCLIVVSRALLTLYGSQGANYVNDITQPGINEAVRRLCCVPNFDNQLIMMLITILLMIEDRCNNSFAKNACYVHTVVPPLIRPPSPTAPRHIYGRIRCALTESLCTIVTSRQRPPTRRGQRPHSHTKVVPSETATSRISGKNKMFSMLL